MSRGPAKREKVEGKVIMSSVTLLVASLVLNFPLDLEYSFVFLISSRTMVDGV